MRTVCVLLGMLSFCVKIAAGAVCDEAFFSSKDLEVVEKPGANGEFRFYLSGNQFNSSGLRVEIKAKCQEAQRKVLIVGDTPFEMIPEYFSDGKVRQYVVKVCGRASAFIKIDRPSFRRDSHYTQPRLLLTDQFDRISAEIANGENEEKQLTVRDMESQIIARGRLVDGARWELNSVALDPLMSALLLCAARIETNSCESVVEHRENVRNIALGTGLALIFSGIYFFRDYLFGN